MKGLGKTMWSAIRAFARPKQEATRRIGVVMALAFVALAGQAEAQVLKRVQMSVGGGMHAANRSYAYYASSKANHDGYNMLVYALHDDGQTAEEFAQSSGWIKLAEDNGFVVIFPEAQNKTWSPYRDEEDAYLKEVYDSTLTHLVVDAAPGDGRPAGPPRGAGEGGPPARGAGGEGGPPRRAAGGEGGPPARGAGGEGGAMPGAAGRPGGIRIGSWQPWQYFTGAGSGGRVAQEFAMNHPGLVTSVATLNGVVYPASYAHGEETSQGEFQNQLGGKTNVPLYRPLKKDVPVPAWLFTAGAPAAPQAKLADYWKHSDGVAPAPHNQAIGGFQTAVYTSPRNAVQQVRVTAAPAGTRYDPAMTSAIWQFFSHIARFSSSPDGQLGPMMTLPEVKQAFEERHAKVGDRDFLYWVKTPSSYAKGKSMPLVIALHGGGYPAWMYLSQIKMHEVGEKEGFVTVYLNAPNNRWQFNAPETDGTRAIAQVIEEMAANYGIDRGRVYLQGFSIGSGMTFVEGITHPQLFAAVSPNSGLGDFEPAVMRRVAEMKAKGLRLPMLAVYGAQDRQSSTDGLIPAQGVLRNAIDTMKAYDGVTTPDRPELFQSPNATPYEILAPGGRLTQTGPDVGYPKGRFLRYDYVSADAKQPIFSWVWAIDMPHGQAPGQAQLEWDFFKSWRRNPDGSLTYTAH
ncbi:MAG: Poly(3-hydroxybutyrate) depolymerase-like protein [Caulobacteraceae bacterium]|nr:Poly(3-hydroxybutyrate) depolymerase-like protein [Caulobacteraceae bacterium]